MHFLYNDADVVAKYLTQDFVVLCGSCPAFKAASELAFYHEKRGFHITSLVIVLIKFLGVQLKIIVHLPPDWVPMRLSCHAFLKGYERDATEVIYAL